MCVPIQLDYITLYRVDEEEENDNDEEFVLIIWTPRRARHPDDIEPLELTLRLLMSMTLEIVNAAEKKVPTLQDTQDSLW